MGITLETFEIHGPDVSEFQGVIDWEKAIAVLHPDFVAIRLGYGKSIDQQFNTNWVEARGKTLRIPYWYLDYYSNYNNTSLVYGTTNEEWGKLQARYMWERLKLDNDNVIVFLDIENGGNSYAPAMNLVTARVHAIAKAFLEEMDLLNGKFNGIYTSLGWLDWFSAWFKDRPLWVAWYNEMMTSLGKTIPRTAENIKVNVRSKGWTGKVLIWQYASDGCIDDDGAGEGIEAGMDSRALDLDVWVGTKADFLEFKGIPIPAPLPIYPSLAIPAISQNNPLWANKLLGTSVYRIGDEGCLITDVAAIATFYGHPIDPGVLNDRLKSINGYESYSLYIWDKLTELFPEITMDWKYFLKEGVTDALIDEVLTSKRPVMVQVDRFPSSSIVQNHWVIILGKDESGYIMMDPWDGFIGYFSSRYVKALRMAVYTHGVPEVPPTTPTTLKVIRTVYVRDVPIGFAGSQVIATWYKGKVVTPLETITIGDNIWVKVTPWSVVAKKYGGIVYLE